MAFLWIDSAARISSNIQAPAVSRRVRQIDGISPVITERPFGDELKFAFDKGSANLSSPARHAYEQASTLLKSTHVNLLASDLMTSPVKTLITSQSLQEAITFIIEHRFRHLPVINSEGKLVGILSDRDIYKYYYQHIQSSNGNDPSVSEVAKSPVLATNPNTPIKDIVRTLFEEGIGAMPILEGDSHLVGIITRSDILRVILEKTHFDLFV